MKAHPMLLTIIWHGYQYRYFSRKFGKFLKRELCCDDKGSKDDPDLEAYKRTKEFIRGKDFILLFYPDMLEEKWPDALPDY
jgi:hypothetical protein